MAIVARDKIVGLWCIDDGLCHYEMRHRSRILAMDHARGKRVLTICADGLLRVWEGEDLTKEVALPSRGFHVFSSELAYSLHELHGTVCYNDDRYVYVYSLEVSSEREEQGTEAESVTVSITEAGK